MIKPDDKQNIKSERDKKKKIKRKWMKVQPVQRNEELHLCSTNSTLKGRKYNIRKFLCSKEDVWWIRRKVYKTIEHKNNIKSSFVKDYSEDKKRNWIRNQSLWNKWKVYKLLKYL